MTAREHWPVSAPSWRRGGLRAPTAASSRMRSRRGSTAEEAVDVLIEIAETVGLARLVPAALELHSTSATTSTSPSKPSTMCTPNHDERVSRTTRVTPAGRGWHQRPGPSRDPRRRPCDREINPLAGVRPVPRCRRGPYGRPTERTGLSRSAPTAAGATTAPIYRFGRCHRRLDSYHAGDVLTAGTIDIDHADAGPCVESDKSENTPPRFSGREASVATSGRPITDAVTGATNNGPGGVEREA